MPLVSDDDGVVRAQIGRPPRAPADVVCRCPLGLPVVLRVPPVLPDGEPFPTRYWLSCPLAVRRASRLEAAGGVRDAEARRARDPQYAEALERAHARYAAERDRDVPGDARHRPRGGVGGVARGVKCLHAHLADHLAGNPNPVGADVASRVLPLDCEVPCVTLDGPRPRRSREWREPPAPAGSARLDAHGAGRPS